MNLKQMDTHQSYEIRLKHPPDFRVRYRFYSEKEGGRKSLPYQGYRSDFWYDYENHIPTSIFMIWPEFEDEHGHLIIELKPVSSIGTARMWIIMPKMRAYHQDKIQIGLKGHFMEASRKVAECEVVELLGLNTNPVE
jgi:hypothetical protein